MGSSEARQRAPEMAEDRNRRSGRASSRDEWLDSALRRLGEELLDEDVPERLKRVVRDGGSRATHADCARHEEPDASTGEDADERG